MIHFRCPLNVLTGLLAAARKRLSDDSGNAIVELALGISFLILPLMLASTQVAFMVYDSIEISNAAHAGAMYGMFSSTLASDTAGITNAARAEASDFGSGLNVTTTTYYACSASLTGTQYSTSAAASSACPSNASNHYLQFVQVSSSAAVVSPITFPGLPKTWTLTGNSVMEVQE